jgi:hypothetical protein
LAPGSITPLSPTFNTTAIARLTGTGTDLLGK